MKHGSKVALGGILVAIAFIVMLFSFIDFGGYIFPAIAGGIIWILMVEIDEKSALVAYISLSILSLLFIPSVDSKMMFIALFGYYPSLKYYLDQRKIPKVPRIIINFVLFNIVAISSHLLLFYVFAVDVDMFVIGGFNLPILFLIIGNITFFLYDNMLKRYYIIYNKVLKDKLYKIFKR